MNKESLNVLMCNQPEDECHDLKIGCRGSFVTEDDTDTELQLPVLINRPSRGGSNTTEEGNEPISISGSNNSSIDGTLDVHKSSPVQKHVNQIFLPWHQHQQAGLGYCGQSFQVSVPVDPRFVPVYQQVQGPPSPQPFNRLTSQTYGQPLPIQQSRLVTPQEYGLQRSISTTPTIDQQQYPYQEVSCSDTQSVSSVGSLYPSGMSTPIYPSSYHDQNLGNQQIISPLSAQSYPSSQVITQNMVPPPDMPPFYLTNAKGYPVPSNMNLNINQISSIPTQPQLNLETVYASTHINITPPQKTKTKTRVSLTTKGREDAIYKKSFSYTEEQHEKHSNLYVTWAGETAQLRHELELKSIELHSIQKTAIKDLWNVVFDTHSGARKAFTTQREIKIRMVPPRGSKKNWLRNPGPKFLVQYETKCRLDVREGKAVVHDLVGTLLMSTTSSQQYKGCHIWADQLKGNRIRIVGIVGKFMLPCRKVIDMKETPPMPAGNTPFGWVSYKSRTTREEFATRISGNLLEEYIYNRSADLHCT